MRYHPRFIRNIQRLVRLIALGIVLALGLPACSLYPGLMPRAQGGVLDLRSQDFRSDATVELGGEWQFHAARLLHQTELDGAGKTVIRHVPDLWQDDDAGGKDGQGCGTYVLRVLLPPDCPPLSIRYTSVATAFEMDAYGFTIAQTGRPSADPRQAIGGCAPALVALPVNGAELTLVVRVSNYEYRNGGMWRSFILGESKSLARWKKNDDLLAMVLFAVFVAIAFNSFTVYLFRRKERSQLFFAIFTLLLSLRPLITGDYLLAELLPQMPFGLMVRLLYGLSFLPIPAAVLFFSAVFPDLLNRRISLWLILPVVPFLLMVPFAPLPVLTRAILFFYAVALVCMAGMFFGGLVRAALRRRTGALAMVIAAGVMIATAINDVFVASFVFRGMYLLPYGLTVMIIIQSAVLSKRSSAAFDRVEELSTGILETNRLLEEEIEQRKNIQGQLEISLLDKDSLIRNVHHWVKNSLQIVSSLISLESRRVADPVQRERYGNIRARIRSISLVHEQLYRSSSGDSLDLATFTDELMGYLMAQYDVEKNCTVQLDIDPLPVPAKFSVDYGLIIAELVSNSVKFAITPRAGGTIRIALALAGNELLIDFADDGPGFPAGFVPAKAGSLGYRMMMSIIASYGGRCEIPESGGSRINIHLGLPEPGGIGGT